MRGRCMLRYADIQKKTVKNICFARARITVDLKTCVVLVLRLLIQNL